jgi:hypothetical protein
MAWQADTKYLTATGNKVQILTKSLPGAFPLGGLIYISGSKEFGRWAADGVHNSDPNHNLVPYTINVSAEMLALASAAGVPAATRVRNVIRQWVKENYETLQDAF